MITDRREVQAGESDGDVPRVLLELSGPNVVVRTTPGVDRAYTASLAEVINAATIMDTSVVVDPIPIRCDDSFAGYQRSAAERPCSEHPSCGPSEAEVVAAGIVSLRTECSFWMIDVRVGRFAQLDTAVDVRFLGDGAWRPLVAVCITPTRLVALEVEGVLTSARRAHRATAA